MSQNRIVWTGLDELRAELRKLPADLADEASGIVNGIAGEAKREIVDDYPTRSGDLKDHVAVRKVSAGPYGAGVMVINTSKLASIFENGTQARHTSLGANRGAMPAGHVFVPVMIRKRREMYEKLKALLVRHGLVVSGDA